MANRKIGFDNEKYLEEQSSAILERAAQFDNKLYLEFGGKLVFDFHASRILPGFDPNAKIRLLQYLRERIDIVICLYAGDIERRKVRADFGITYDADTLRLIDDLRSRELDVRAVCITRYEEQPSVKQFIAGLEQRGIQVYTHRTLRGYPTNVDLIVSEEGYGANCYIKTEKPIVVVTAPGPGSGKMATCLSQLYHEQLRGVSAGYAKFETFPIWNLPLKHPVNIAYEAATADIGDYNELDPFHLDAFGETAVNYNRDVEIFPVVRRIMTRIMDEGHVYKSPTEMGVNRVGFAICDDAVVCSAAKQEMIRRYFRYHAEYIMGLAEKDTVDRAKLLMDELNLNELDRPVVKPARDAAATAQKQPEKGSSGIFCGAAIELPDGRIVTGKNSPGLHAASSLILNAIKILAGLPEELYLIPPGILDSIAKLRTDILSSGRVSMDLTETLIALSVSAANNPGAEMAMGKLRELKNCEMHITHIPTPGDDAGLRRLGINLTSDPNFSSHSLFAG